MISHPRVLVVDDSPTTCLFIAATLEQAGYDVEIALKGHEGLAKVKVFQPYCVILDVMLPDISAFQAVIALFISLRAFYLYSKARNDILFIVGLSMTVIVVGGVAGLAGDFLITSSAFNTFWFRYIGQIMSYLFIFFISLPGAEHHMRFLKRLNLVATAFLSLLLLLTPVLPPIPGVRLTEVLSGARGAVCLAVFFNYYIVVYSMKGTRFSALMCFAFILIATGIAVYTIKFSVPNPLPYDYVGDSIRAVGLAFMLAAFFVG